MVIVNISHGLDLSRSPKTTRSMTEIKFPTDIGGLYLGGSIDNKDFLGSLFGEAKQRSRKKRKSSRKSRTRRSRKRKRSRKR